MYLLDPVDMDPELDWSSKPQATTDDTGAFVIEYYGDFTGFLFVASGGSCTSVMTGETLSFPLVSMVHDDMVFDNGGSGAVVSPLTTMVAALYQGQDISEDFPTLAELEATAKDVEGSFQGLGLPEGSTLFNYNPLDSGFAASTGDDFKTRSRYLDVATQVSTTALAGGALFSSACSVLGSPYPISDSALSTIESMVAVKPPPALLMLTSEATLKIIYDRARTFIAECPAPANRKLLSMSAAELDRAQASSVAGTSDLNKLSRDEAAAASSPKDLISAVVQISTVAETAFASNVKDLSSGSITAAEFEDSSTGTALEESVAAVEVDLEEFPVVVEPPAPPPPAPATPAPVVDPVNRGDWYFWSENVIITVACGCAAVLLCTLGLIGGIIYCRRDRQAVEPFAQPSSPTSQGVPEVGTPPPASPLPAGGLSPQASPSTSSSTYYKMGPPQPGLSPSGLRSPGQLGSATANKQKEEDARMEFENILKEQQDYIARRLQQQPGIPGTPPSPGAASIPGLPTEQMRRPGVGTSLAPLGAGPSGLSPKGGLSPLGGVSPQASGSAFGALPSPPASYRPGSAVGYRPTTPPPPPPPQ